MQPGDRLGPYEILSLVGTGGMGEVYKARDTRLNRDVAVKVLPKELTTDPDRLWRFEVEAQAAGALNHPNVLAIYDVGSHEGSPFLVCELLEGETLRELLMGGSLTPRKTVEIGIQIAQGLAAAHEKGIVHRDLKPGNVFITSAGVVKILDFGLAKLRPALQKTETEPPPTVADGTSPGLVVGTVGYMAPEQVRGHTADNRADIFALGCVLYEMFTGRRAFGRATPADTMSAILHEDPPALESGAAHLPGPLCQVVRRCLEKRPQDRFSSAHDLAFALEAAATDTSSGRAIPEAAPRRTRLRGWLATCAVLVAVLAAWGYWLARPTGSASLPEFHPRKVAGQYGGVSDAALSPDGNEIAYADDQNGATDIWVADVRGGRAIRLTDGSSSVFGPGWFPDGGTVIFSLSRGSETSIWKVPRFGGSAILLIPNAQDGAISADGSQIAFARPQKDGALRIWVAPLSAPESARQLTADGAGLWDHRHPVWSPDARTICYCDQRDLWLVPSAGGKARLFTHDDAGDSEPVWSTSGRYVYFVSDRGGTQSLWRKAVGGGTPVRVTRGASIEESPTISRDGRHLAFLAGRETQWIAIADLQTGRVSRMAYGGRTGTAAVAPDRSSVVFAADLAGSWDLWSVALRDNAPVGEPARLTDHSGTCAVPKFSPDGRWIAYYRVVAGRRDVWVMPALSGIPTNFTDQPSVNVEPAWSPDGRRIAFISNRGGWHQVWTAPFADGRRAGEPLRITGEEGDAAGPCWSGDGRLIAYIFSTGAGSDVRLARSDGRGETRGLTSGARAVKVRWFQPLGGWAVSGFWGERLPSIRVIPADGGAPTRLPIPSPIVLDREYPHFDSSADGRLLTVFQRSHQEEIWVLDVDEGLF